MPVDGSRKIGRGRAAGRTRTRTEEGRGGIDKVGRGGRVLILQALQQRPPRKTDLLWRVENGRRRESGEGNMDGWMIVWSVERGGVDSVG